MPMPVRDLMRAINLSKILETIRTVGMISRRDIARSTGLSKALVTGLTSDLIREGLIIEKKSGEYEGGRRPILLALNPEGAFVVGVNLSFQEIGVVIVNFKGDVVNHFTKTLAPRHHSVEQIADYVVAAVQSCIWDANFAREQISGVGIGIPGLVNPDTGLIRFLPNYGWKNVNLKKLVEVELNHSCYVDNSTNTLALAQQWFGEGKGVENFLVVTIATGVGLGAVINGRIYRGANGVASEFGHTTINPEGPKCRCGKRGCVEAYAGKIAILRDARQAARENRWQCNDIQNLTYEEIVLAAQGGEETLRRIFMGAGEKLGIGLSNLITLYNPSKIVITGKGVQAGDFIFNPMFKTLNAISSARLYDQPCNILIQQWTEQDWARGAGGLVLRELYKTPVGQVAMDH
jgi:predicted NBD/HSP70 family sugar kinase